MNSLRGLVAALSLPLVLLSGCSSAQDAEPAPLGHEGHEVVHAGAHAAAPDGGLIATEGKPLATDYLHLANETHEFIVTTLLTRSGSYKAAPQRNETDEWHDISQIGADVAMLAKGDASYRPYVDNTYAFMDHLWDLGSPIGGYFAMSAPDGSAVDKNTKFVDDNSLAAVTYLDAYAAITDPAARAPYLVSAQSVANFLMQSDLWDSTYDGGFYWSTAKENKPTQSNGLALQLFVRLANVTGDAVYTTWATKIASWLDGKMFDDAAGLYSWQWEATGRNEAKFTYDQAILIDAQLDLYAADRDEKHLDRARSVANAMHAALWDPTHGGYVISTQDRRLSPVYSAWASYSLVHLYEVDKNPVWLSRAAQNLSVLDARLRDPATHGYYSSSNPDGTNRSNDIQAVDQAWMQRAQARMAGH